MISNVNEFLKNLDDSWNSHDLEKILSHYSEDYESISPAIKRGF